ncbi:O-antigen ligase family protein [Formosa sp. S-31]|uniref:O-antigen ligase family protein n=1 Tax=Formosa sp. S-31 TaxID=2790949 RepID=UPI003EBB1AE3
MKNKLIFVCFIWPLICSCLNIQRLTSAFISIGFSQFIAYTNLILIILGFFFIIKDRGELSKTAGLWFYFYLLYYCLGIIASGIYGFENPEVSLLASLVPLIYFIGFYFFLSNQVYFSLFTKVITISYVLSSFITILLFKINYDFDKGGFYLYKLDRAGGAFADANNASFVSILAFLFFQKFYVAKNTIQKIFKISILLVIFYSIFITLSTTGLFIFVLVFILTNYKLLKGFRVLLFSAIVVLFYFGLFLLKDNYNQLNLSDNQIKKVDNIVNVLTLNTDKIDSSERGELVQNLLYYVNQKPLLGNGIGFSSFMRGHNTYIGVWGDAGIITFLFFLFMLIIYLVKTLLLKNHIKFFCLSLLTTIYVFMLTLQTVINQSYVIVVFAFLGYIIDKRELLESKIQVNK